VAPGVAQIVLTVVDNPSGCRLCGGSRVECLGGIPASDYFAGRVLRQPIAGGQLWRCASCDSLFRHPILSSAEYHGLYESGASGQWSGDSERQDLQVVRSLVLAHPGSRVLDVGCGTGDFLASLPATVSKFGIEPAAEAGSEARRRGSCIARSFEELPADARFDVITIIDVIEHVTDPALFLDQAYARLAAGGLIVISTGDPHNRLWRDVFRSRFWYSSFPEHIVFPSRQFYDRWAASHGAETAMTLSTRYRTLPLWKSALFLVIQAVYLASPGLLNLVGRSFGRVRRLPEPRRQHFSPGVSGLFVDHWVVGIRRSAHH
jgi:SAM-dependent methyltransferase